MDPIWPLVILVVVFASISIVGALHRIRDASEKTLAILEAQTAAETLGRPLTEDPLRASLEPDRAPPPRRSRHSLERMTCDLQSSQMHVRQIGPARGDLARGTDCVGEDSDAGGEALNVVEKQDLSHEEP